MIHIVCYTGGTCGDLVSAMIDARDAEIRESGAVFHAADRTRLKKPHLFVSDQEKDQYLESVIGYLSISSHDTDYHMRRGHAFVSVGIQRLDTAIWAAQRFRDLHRPQVWQEMTARCGAETLEQYAQIMMDYSSMVANHTRDVVKLESIVQGTAVTELQDILGRPLQPDSVEFYHNWLRKQNL
jgi:hypothetical protein